MLSVAEVVSRTTPLEGLLTVLLYLKQGRVESNPRQSANGVITST